MFLKSSTANRTVRPSASETFRGTPSPQDNGSNGALDNLPEWNLGDLYSGLDATSKTPQLAARPLRTHGKASWKRLQRQAEKTAWVLHCVSMKHWKN